MEMPLRLRNPSWIDQSLLKTGNVDEFTESVFSSSNERLGKILSDSPVVSVVIAAYNEQTNIVRCIESLSHSTTKYPLEIIIVDNNSSDRTAEMIRKFNVTYVFQKIQGCGIARQLGQETARGKYILTGDADTLYPKKWIDKMMKSLTRKGVVCVFGRYSFISDERTPRWKLTIYETLSDAMVIVKNFKRPYLNAYGMTMGYVREYGLKVGYVEANIRGEDGRLAFDLMKFGKIKAVMSTSARVLTGMRTIGMDGRLRDALRNRVTKFIAQFGDFFRKEKDHDTKTSENGSADFDENLKAIKRKIGMK